MLQALVQWLKRLLRPSKTSKVTTTELPSVDPEGIAATNHPDDASFADAPPVADLRGDEIPPGLDLDFDDDLSDVDILVMEEATGDTDG